MPARTPLPDDLPERFRVGDALDLGASQRRLWGQDLERPFWGVRAPAGSCVDIEGLARAYAARMQPHAFFSHLTAAALWGLPLPSDRESSLHVSVPHPRRAPEGAGIRGHRLRITSYDVLLREGLRRTSIERTLLDLAGYLDDDALLAAIDNARWWRRSGATRTTIDALEQAMSRFEGRRGLGRARELITFSTDRADAPPESVFRRRFHLAGFPPAEPNRNIYGRNGRFLAMPDLQFGEYRMAFDYEGDHHRTDKRQWRKDLRRAPQLEDEGWHYTRISGDDLAEPGYLIARTHRILLSRGWRPDARGAAFVPSSATRRADRRI